MKKIRIILYVIILILLVIPKVFAVNEVLYFSGKDSVELNTNNKEKVNISCNEKIGAISGKISCSGNIQIVEVKGIGDWNLTYNKDNGEFIMYNVKGQDKGEIAEIEYLATNKKENKTFLKLEDIEFTKMNYETQQVQSVTKEIRVPQKSNYIIFIVIIVLVLLIVAGTAFFIIKKKK